MSGMKYTGMALAVTLSAALIFSACGKKEKDEQPVETDSVVEFSMDDSTEAIPAEVIPEIDPNESYAAQVQAELGDVEIPTTDITTKTAAVSVPALSQTMSTPDGNVQIKVPGTWTDLKGQIDATGALEGYTIQTGSMSEALFLTYTSEAKSDAENSPITSIDDYSGWLVQYVSSVNSALQNARVVSKSDLRERLTDRMWYFSSTLLRERPVTISSAAGLRPGSEMRRKLHLTRSSIHLRSSDVKKDS